MRRSAVLAALAMALALAGCAGPPPSRADAAALAACRQRADEVYAKQNRAELYESDTFATSGRDSPYAVADLPGVPTRGLSGLYQRDNLIGDCLAGTGAGTGVGTGAGTVGAHAPAASAGPSPTATPPAPTP